jgi:hypothetical protein
MISTAMTYKEIAWNVNILNVPVKAKSFKMSLADRMFHDDANQI